eukprot:jgi/Hompol1/5646/HPOL_004603-RA
MEDELETIELVQLPGYKNYRVIATQTLDDMHIVIQSAESVSEPGLRVICKSAAVGDEETNEFLKAEFAAVVKIHEFVDTLPERGDSSDGRTSAVLAHRSSANAITTTVPFATQVAVATGVKRIIGDSALSRNNSGQNDSAGVSTDSLKDSIMQLTDSIGADKAKRSITRSTALLRLPKPIAIDEHEGSQIAVYDFFEDAVNVRDYIAHSETGVPLHEAVQILLQIAEALEVIHRARYIHKNINSESIVVRKTSAGIACRILNFCFAEEFDGPHSPTVQGVPAYISPEQTGRIGKDVDWRTDFYSLGITMWEILELFYSHIAKEADDPRVFRPLIPKPIIDIVKKLLKKDASERYQTATALRMDLTDICTSLAKARPEASSVTPLSDEEVFAILENLDFSVGSRDFSRQLCFIDKLYGREGELQRMHELFRKVMVGETPLEFLCIVGHSGSGKSALVRAFETDISNMGCHLVIAKVGSNFIAPFAGLISVMDQLIKLILTETNEVLNTWKRRLSAALNSDALAYISKLVPSIKTIVADLESGAVGDDMDSIEGKMEIYRAIEGFLGVFATQERPLAIYLDNIEASGSNTVELLRFLFQRKRLRHVFVLGSVVPKEQQSLKAVLARLQQDMGHWFETIELGAISIDAIRTMLNDSLRPPIGDVVELAVLLYTKTQGNPLHIKEYIKVCEAEGLIRFDEQLQGWIWSIKEMDRKTDLTDNVVELLISEFKTLPADTQKILREASCIGLQFDSKMFVQSMYSPYQVSQFMAPAISGGFVSTIAPRRRTLSGSLANAFLSAVGPNGRRASRKLSNPLATVYKFCHARLHSAVYNSIEPIERKQIHLSIARYLKDSCIEEEINEKLFEILHHFSEAKDVIIDNDERIMILDLCRQGASRALTASDLNQTQKHIRVAEYLIEKLTQEHAIEQSYSNVFEVMKMDALSAIRLGDSVRAESVLEKLKKIARPQDRNQVSLVAVEVCHAQADFDQVVSVSLEAMASLGVSIPSDHALLDSMAKQEFSTLCALIEDEMEGGAQVKTSCVMPPVNLKLLDMFISYCENAARTVGQLSLCSLLASKGCINALTHGHGQQAVQHFSNILGFICKDIGKYEAHFKFVTGLIEKFRAKMSPELQATSMVAAVCGLSYIWTPQETFDTLIYLMESAFDACDTDVGMFIAIKLAYCVISTGAPFETMFEPYKTYLSRVHPTFEFNRYHMNVQYLFMTIESLANGCDVWPDINMASIRRVKMFGSYVHFLNACIFQREERFSMVASMDAIREAFAGFSLFVDIALSQVITYSALCLHHPDKKMEYLEKIAELTTLIELVINVQPSQDYACKLHLALAEQARAKEDVSKAVKLYEEAIENAHSKHIVFIEAWATELHGHFWIEHKSKRLAKPCMISAVQLWSMWGCEAKAASLASKFPDMTDESATRRNSRRLKIPISTFRPSGTTDQGSLELASPTRPTLSTGTDDRTVSPQPKSATIQTSTALFGGRKAVDVDLSTVLKVASSLSNEKSLEELLDKMLSHVMVNTGATRTVLLLNENGQMWITATSELSEDGTRKQVMQRLDAETHPLVVPLSVVNYVFRIQQPLVFMEMPEELTYRKDPYMEATHPKSILCCPIKHQNNRTGVLYLENTLQNGAFTPSRMEFVQSLMGSASISIENVRLMKKNQELSEALRETTEQQKNLSTTGGGPRYNFDAPIKRVFDAVDMIKARFGADDPEIKKLEQVMSLLTSDGLFAANIDDVNDENGHSLDQDTKSFIEASMLSRMAKNTGGLPSVMFQSASELALNGSFSSSVHGGVGNAYQASSPSLADSIAVITAATPSASQTGTL